ncbi:MAG: hypothetical protein AB8B65_08565 [Kordia sp.]|uniref:hypothetical protein n=1 Tax=Kordia sp. TaxID=1965332 RepID=UPI00385E5692
MKKELIYIFIILLVFYGIHGFPMDMETIRGIATIDVNVHDSYYVVQSHYYWIITLSFAFAITYLIRILLLKFKNKYANIIYLITNAAFIVSLAYVIQFLNIIIEQYSEKGLATNSTFYTYFYITTALLLFSVIMEIFVLFKMWKK